MRVDEIYQGDALTIANKLPNKSLNCIITSPPYWGLRDYGVDGQLGLEKTFDEYIANLCSIFDVLKDKLRDDGTCWVNLGDSYHNATKWNVNGDTAQTISNGNNRNYINDRKPSQGLPEKSLCMIPFRFAIEMVNRGWILRNDIIWHKPNCMPSSAKDRFTVDFEHVFFFTKSKRYYFEQQFEPMAESTIKDIEAGYPTCRPNTKATLYIKNGIHGAGSIGEPTKKRSEIMDINKGRNKRAVWSVTTKGFPEAHFATFPEALIEPMIKAGCPEFVCKRCGKAREKIWKNGNLINQAGYREGHQGRTGVHIGASKSSSIITGYVREKIYDGYTDCGCNAGFDGGIAYDPFMGAGTVAVVAKRLNRHYLGSELNQEYINMANRRIAKEIPQMEFQLAGG